MSQSNTEEKKPARKGRPPKAAQAVTVAQAAAPALPAAMTPSEEAGAFMALLERAARDPSIDVEKMRALLGMKKEVLEEQRKAAFNTAYMLARLEIPRVRKDGSVEYAEDKNNPNGPKKKAFNYAKYEDIDKAIRPIEQKYGFARIFTTTPRGEQGGGCVVHCQLLHRDGFYKEAEIAVALDTSGGKNNIQAMGSSFSYGKRYTTEMLWDIVKEGADDDGNAAFMDAPIDDVQFEAFQKIIDENGVDAAKFCAHLKVDSIRAITNKIYPKAMSDLREHVKKKKEAAARAAQEKPAARTEGERGEGEAAQ